MLFKKNKKMYLQYFKLFYMQFVMVTFLCLIWEISH